MRDKVHTYKDGESIVLKSYNATDLFATPVRSFKYKSGAGPGKAKLPPHVYNLPVELGTKTEKHGRNFKRDAQRKAGKIFCDFMDMLASDMIHEHVIFVLPMPGGGYLYVTDLNTIRPEKQRCHNPRTGGAYFVPILHRGQRLDRKGFALYTIRFNRKWRNELFKKVLEGERYIN